MRVTEAIALEHAILSRLFDQVEGVLPRFKSAAQVGALATILEGLLTTHAQLEINFAFVALDHALRQKRRLTTLHADHRELDGRLGQVHEARTGEQARRLLRAAMLAAREHFRNEERILFPAVERALGPGALTALGEAYKNAPKAKADHKAWTMRRRGQ